MPHKPGPNDLLNAVLQTSANAQAEQAEIRALVAQAKTRPDAAQWLEDLGQLVPHTEEEALREIYQFAMLGLTLGFLDRNLSPWVEAHREIVGPMLAEIRSVYEQVQQRNVEGVDYQQEAFCYRAFNYGVHKAYYLDWVLYLSHEPY